MKARVYVSFKSTVLDPQGQTIRSALNGLGHKTITAVRQGKFFDVEIAAGNRRANRSSRKWIRWRATCWPIPSSKTIGWRFWIRNLCAESLATSEIREGGPHHSGRPEAAGIPRLRFGGDRRARRRTTCLGVRRAQGKLRNLEEALRLNPVDGSYGIGHTRWATHGRPTEENAHPHRDCHGDIVVVHNGIVENYLALKQQLVEEGHHFVTETDTEIIAHLVEKYFDGNLENAVRDAVRQLTRRVRAERDLAQGSEQDRGRALGAAGGGRAWATANISSPPTCPRF